MLGGFLLLRRAMLEELGGFDAGFRLYGEDIDLQYRAMLAGWERWYVPAAVVRHEHKAETDRRWLTRRTLWHWRGILRFVRKHPERLRSAVSIDGEKYDRAGRGLLGARVRRPGAVLGAARRSCSSSSARGSRPARPCVDLGCGDGIMAGAADGHGLRYIGVDAERADGRGGPRAAIPASPFVVVRVRRTTSRPSRSTRRSACARSTTPRTASPSSAASRATRG